MNRRAKFDAASFIVGGEICNRTNTQTVNDISTPRLSACVDNRMWNVCSVRPDENVCSVGPDKNVRSVRPDKCVDFIDDVT